MKKTDFPYLNKSLQFDKKKHEYTLNGIKLISVTSWLKQFEEPFDPYEISEKISKNPNSEYYGMDPAIIRSLWIKTANRGSKKHKTIEKWLTGETSSCDEAEFLIQYNITPQNAYSEIPLISKKLMLAGTADIITVENGQYFIWDIKTAKKVNEDKRRKFSLQILTYCVLLYQMADRAIKVSPGGIILIEPKSNLSKDVSNAFKNAEFIEIDKNVKDELKYMIKIRKKELKQNTKLYF